jgi:cobalt-zinc-cadmium efflux system membrane fusion protein
MSSTTVKQPRELEQAPQQQARPAARQGKLGRFVAFALHHIPTLFVLALLAGVGLAGHSMHWKLPKFSTLVGAAPEKKAAWCEEHSVPESECVECNAGLMPAGPDYGWCSEHGVHNCPLHHPDVAQLKDAPSVASGDLERAARAIAVQERKRNNSVCMSYQRRIQFATHEAVMQAGVDVAPVDRQPIGEWIVGTGEITYDPTRFASLSARVPGAVWRVEKNIGDRVSAGDVLALVDAVEVGRAKTELVRALADEKLQKQNLDRLRGVSGVVAGRQVLEAEANYTKARAIVLSAEQSLINLGLPVDADQLRGLSESDVMDHLRFLGIPDALRSELDPRRTTANLLPIRAPSDGVVVDRQVVTGEVVDANHVAFQVADTSRMWLILNIPLEDAPLLALGQTVRFQADGARQEVEGAISWISTAADRHTRMVQVRAELLNPEGRLRDETFGTGRVILREESDAITVPNSAVHWEGCCQIVFVRDKNYFASEESPKVFHVRTVRLGARNADATEIISGVLPGEVVAAGGSDVLLAQLLKSNLGAGCCEIE